MEGCVPGGLAPARTPGLGGGATASAGTAAAEFSKDSFGAGELLDAGATRNSAFTNANDTKIRVGMSCSANRFTDVSKCQLRGYGDTRYAPKCPAATVTSAPKAAISGKRKFA